MTDSLHLREDPSNERKRIYRVFKEIRDSTGSTSETGHALKGVAKVSSNKAIRDSLASVITNKAACSRDPLVQKLAIKDGQVDPDLPKRPPKEKRQPSEDELKQKEFDKAIKEILF